MHNEMGKIRKDVDDKLESFKETVRYEVDSNLEE